jgi:small-conductance mechanosensitive channel
VVLGFLREAINWYLDRISAEGGTSLKMTLGPLTNKVVDILIGLVAVIVVLDHFGINIGSLLVSLGVGSLAVALAAQDTLANMIAGFVILVDRPFRVGDRIELASGEVGDVKEIGLRSTRMLNFDNNMIIVPNADLVKGRIVNYAFPLKPMRVLLKFDVAYGTEPAKVRQILTGLASAAPGILPDPAPQVFLTGLSDASVQFTLVARASEYGEQYNAETLLREQAYLAFMKEGIAAPVTQRIVHMKATA